jgi:hypothetical protein
VTLPILKRFTFRGVVVYLENLIAQIYTPLLEQLNITLLFQLAFTLVNLTQFVHTIERLRCLSARVLFRRSSASIVTSNGDPRDGGGLTISVICEPLDWQIDSTTQVCGALVQVLSSIEELTLDLEEAGIPFDVENGIPFDGENALDNTLWHGLLLPFRGVRRLHIGSALTSELSNALTSDVAGLGLELLPDLQDLEIQLEIDDAYKAFSTLIKTREHAGRLVRLLASPIPKGQYALPPWRRHDINSSWLDLNVATYYSCIITTCLETQIVHPEVSPPAVPSSNLGMPYRGRPGRDSNSDESRRSRGPRGSRKHSDFAQSIAQNRKLRKRHGYRRA